MLSRNAERVYWLGRYIERTEDTARMLKAFSQVMLDIPKTKKLSWDMLLKLLSSEQDFLKLYDEVNEYNVICFLLADSRNPSSIRSSVKAARENARTSRDMIPLDGWEMLNDLNLLVKQSADSATHRKHRYKFLREIISRSQQFNGIVHSSLSRNQAYDFLQIGTMLERADMTTRILDVAAGILLRRSVDVSSFDTLIWLEILKAQNAVLMYRYLNGPAISPNKVLNFVLCRDEFPRSIKFCLTEIENYAAVLPDNDDLFEGWELLHDKLNTFDKDKEIDPEFLHKFFDEIQKGLIKMHNVIADTWFPRVSNEDSKVQQPKKKPDTQKRITDKSTANSKDNKKNKKIDEQNRTEVKTQMQA